MKDSLHRIFGYVIAYVLPGYIALWGLAAAIPPLRDWITFSPQDQQETIRFLAAVLGSVGAGLVVSAIRCGLVDLFHHQTGLPRPQVSFRALEQQLSAYLLAVEHNYRYYQFYANTAVSIPFAAASYWRSGGELGPDAIWALAVLETVLLLASRDSLRRFYSRTADILGCQSPPPAGQRLAL
jgi:hypothetical protein